MAAVSEVEIKNVLANDFLSASLKRDEMVVRLKRLSAVLNTLDANRWSASKTQIQHALVDKYTLSSKSDEVRLLTACCLADVLRLSAPTPPYSDAQLSDVFALFIEQLRGCSNPTATAFQRHMYLLECLAAVRIYLLLTDLGEEGDRLLLQLFEAIFETAALAAGHGSASAMSVRVEFHFKEMMATVFEELEVVSQPLLDCLLTKIIPPYREENRRAATLAEEVLHRCAARLETPISDFLVAALIRMQSTESSLDDAQQQRALVIELARIAPATLQTVLPQFGGSLRVAEVDVRLETCRMLCEIFVAHPNTIGRDYHLLLDALLRRMADADAEVRLLLVQHAKQWLLLYPQTAQSDAIQQLLEARVVDSDDRIRAACMQQICEAALELPESVPAPLVLAVAKRTCDRKEHVMRDAVSRLCLLFRTHCLEHWRTARELPEASRRFLFLPKRLVAACTQDAYRSALIVEEALEEVLLDRRFSVEERTRCLVGFFAALDSRSQAALLLKLLVPKQFVQAGVRQLLAVREARKSESASTQRAAAHALAQRLARFLPDTTPGSSPVAETESLERCAEQLIELCIDHPDGHTARFLAQCASPSTDRATLATAKKELLRVVGARSQSGPLKEFARRLQMRLCMTVLTSDSMPFLVQEALASFESGKFALCLSALTLLSALALKFPELVAPQLPVVLQLLERHLQQQASMDVEEGDEQCTHAMSRALEPAHVLIGRALETVALSTHSAQARALIDKPVHRRLMAAARSFVAGGTISQAESATRILLHLNSVACAHSTAPLTNVTSSAAPGSSAAMIAAAVGPFAGLTTSVGCALFPISTVAQTSAMALQAPPIPVASPPTVEVRTYFSQLMEELVAELLIHKVPKPTKGKKAAAAAPQLNTQLPSTLASLALLALEVPHVFAASSTKLLRFVQQQLLFARPRSTAECEVVVAAKEAGVRVLVAYLFATDVDTWQSKSEAVPIFKLLFKLIENDGRLPPADESEQMDEVEDEHSRDERNRVCLAAGRGLLELCTSPRFERMLLSVHVETLFAVALSESAIVRADFVSYAADLLTANRLRFRYTCILAMSALAVVGADGSTDATSQQNARALRDWSRRRVSMMVIRQHQISAHFAQKQQAVPQEFYPEHVIGDLIHALAHHPAMVANDEGVLRHFARPLNFLLDALLDSNLKGAPTGSGQNFPILDALLITLRKHAVDACPAAPEHPTNVAVLAELAHTMLLSKLRARKWNTTPFPEPIRLRASLFKEADTSDMFPKRLLPAGFDWHESKKSEARVKGLASPDRGGDRRKSTESVAATKRVSKKAKRQSGGVWADKASESETESAAQDKASGDEHSEIEEEAAPTRRQPARSSRRASAKAVTVSESEQSEVSEEEEEESTSGRAQRYNKKVAAMSTLYGPTPSSKGRARV